MLELARSFVCYSLGLLWLLTLPPIAFSGEIEKKEVLEELRKLEEELSVCSGIYKYDKLEQRFSIRGELMMVTEIYDGETIVKLWNKHGFFVIKKTEGENWTLEAKDKRELQMQINPDKYALEGAKVADRLLSDLLSWRDIETASITQDTDNIDRVAIELVYTPGMRAYNWGDLSMRDKAPTLDKALVKLNAQKNYRVEEYTYKIEMGGETGLRKVKLSYDESFGISIPSKLTVEFCRTSGEKVREESASFEGVSATAPVATAFELEHYGIVTPSVENNNSRWPIFILTLAFILFVALVAFFFFRR
jgi:hypothetical protein